MTVVLVLPFGQNIPKTLSGVPRQGDKLIFEAHQYTVERVIWLVDKDEAVLILV